MQQQPARPPQDSDDRPPWRPDAEQADGILVVDAEGLVRFINPAAAAILGRHGDELVGQQFGSPMLRGERAEIDLLHPGGEVQVAEMRVVDTEWEGAPALLVSLRDITEHRRAQRALRDAEAFNWAILNSLTVHLAVLDAGGTIIAVNDAWREFARVNGDPKLRSTGIGVNYFTVCGHATGPDADEAPQVVEGMRAVLAGRAPFFELEYPCHSPSEERWFSLRVVPLRGARPGLLVSHTNVTNQRHIARAAAEAEALRERLRALEQELRDVDQLSRDGAASPRRLRAEPLRRREPGLFAEALASYRALLNQALDARARHGPAPDAMPSAVGPGLRALGERLGAHGAAPRDVVEVHLAAVRAAAADAPQVRQQTYLEEGRLLVLELMGYLTAHYRARALGRDGKPGA
ncbi:MAG TPA: PAS domain-containing protein [Chloroflexaceae bacterium]|nr:PAS domain-containing protein [Chloroflexaceae bacterium]